MWHTRSGFPRRSFGFRPRISFTECMIVIALVGILGAIVAAAVADAGGRSLGGPVIGAIDDGSPAAARHAAESLGFTNVRVTDEDDFGPEFQGCDEDDVAYSVVARNQLEKDVQLTVCCGGFGSLKGCTVRTR